MHPFELRDFKRREPKRFISMQCDEKASDLKWSCEGDDKESTKDMEGIGVE